MAWEIGKPHPKGRLCAMALDPSVQLQTRDEQAGVDGRGRLPTATQTRVQ
jgi:hypothetical protein